MIGIIQITYNPLVKKNGKLVFHSIKEECNFEKKFFSFAFKGYFLSKHVYVIDSIKRNKISSFYSSPCFYFLKNTITKKNI